MQTSELYISRDSLHLDIQDYMYHQVADLSKAEGIVFLLRFRFCYT